MQILGKLLTGTFCRIVSPVFTEEYAPKHGSGKRGFEDAWLQCLTCKLFVSSSRFVSHLTALET